MTRSVLITGGAGFIGSHLVRRLAERGDDVHVLDPKADPSLFPTGVTCHDTSILDEAALQSAMAGRDIVFHLAAFTGLWARDKRIFDRLNHQGTKAVIAAAAGANVARLIVTSTALILRGWNDPDESPVSEQTPRPSLMAMAGPYSRSKWLADDAIRRAVADGMDIVTLYPTVPMGPPGRFMTPPTEMLKQFLLRPPPLYLDMTLNLLHVDDAALGHVLAAEKAPPKSRFILGGETMTFRDFLTALETFSGHPMPKRTVSWRLAAASAHMAEAFAKLSGQPPTASVEGIRVARHIRHYDTAYAQKLLGWSPRPIHETLEEATRSVLATHRL